MIPGARYVHTNLIAFDWRNLARFYSEVFGCTPVPPERHYAGPALERGTAVTGARLDGIHLTLPGYEGGGPTLEIYTYSIVADSSHPAVNRPGYAHIAFAVDDVERARQSVLDAGGRGVGDVVTLRTATGSAVTWCYVADPEGNILELQRWG